VTRAEGPLQTGSMDPDRVADPPGEDRSDGGAWIGWQLAQFENSPRDAQPANPAGKAKLHQTLDPEPLAAIRGPTPRPEADRGLCQRVSALGTLADHDRRCFWRPTRSS
jgi:hypothetical protein